MTTPAALARAYGQSARKRFGQHFLVSSAVVDRIVALAEIGPGSKVVEVGPGPGALTEALLRAGAEVLAVELDRDVAAFLRSRHADNPAFRLVEADALSLDWGEVLDGEGWICASNLPYNVGTAILLSMLDRPDKLSRLVVMVQKEVAERLVAPVGARERGSLSVHVEARARSSGGFKVPPGAFRPPPAVDSAVLRLDLLPAPATAPEAPALVEAVVQAGFSAPRKAVRNGIASRFGREAADAALAAAGVEPTHRPAVLALGDWVRLAGALRALDAAPSPA
jgi:16S rRNA (adenine1518-N6/adenine1519-N6)-dimethyltransferase